MPHVRTPLVVALSGVLVVAGWLVTDRPTVSRLAASVASSVSDGVGEDDGVVPSGVHLSVTSDVPAVARLDPGLLSAVQRAARAAEEDGITMHVTSGWRSAAYQERLLEDATKRYGSREEAARWVATPTTSAHVRGEAVDIGPTDADSWLMQHGARYGLCQTYANEMWHFELREVPAGGTCPQPYADPTEDPRLRA